MAWLFFAALGASEKDPVIYLTPDQIEDSGIKTKEAGAAQLSVSISIPAKIVVNQEKHVHIVARASAIVKDVFKNIGDFVKQGQTLALLESREVAEAKAAYISAFRKWQLASQMQASEEALKNKKISSGQDYLQANQAAQEAFIHSELAKQSLYMYGMQQEDIDSLVNDPIGNLCVSEIKAPISAVVIAQDISRGQLVPEGKEIFTLANLDTVWVELAIFPQVLPLVKRGHEVKISNMKAGSDEAVARLIYVSAVINEQTCAASAIAELSNKEGKWHPGMPVKAQVIVEKKAVPMAVVNDALQEIDGQIYVFIVQPEGFEKKQVHIGISDGTYTEILSGLHQGDIYASENSFLLKAQAGVSEAGDDD
jgi:cobalt-zinc-cadmium efflux system membrane fusion protein